VASKEALVQKSRTAKLWLQYMDHITLVKDFIRAERTGNWQLHLTTVHRMLNLFAAAGHTNYARCGRLYLQLMADLPQTQPWLHEQFMSGYGHCVRRSERFWAALSTDLVIEQTMMKAIKSRGGLTHGRGLSESVRILWVKTMHKSAGVFSSLNSFTEFGNTEVSHIDLGDSRRRHDISDIHKLIDWFEKNDPFQVSDHRLHSLFSGITAGEEDDINCDGAEAVGDCLMEKMNNMMFSEVVICKTDRVKTLASVTSTLSLGDKHVPVDSAVLFSRLRARHCLLSEK